MPACLPHHPSWSGVLKIISLHVIEAEAYSWLENPGKKSYRRYKDIGPISGDQDSLAMQCIRDRQQTNRQTVTETHIETEYSYNLSIYVQCTQKKYR